MEKYVNHAVVTAIGLVVALIRYNLNRTIISLENVKAKSETNKENNIKMMGRIELIENNHSHLSDKFEQLYSAIRDLTTEMKQLNKELSKKKE